MCGIFCELNRNVGNEKGERDIEHIKLMMSMRGPDALGELRLGSIRMIGCTLWMQGSHPIRQPVDSERGALLYNGDRFSSDSVDGKTSDTEALHLKMDHAECADNIIAVLKQFNGPFALIYFQKSSKRLYFCRDPIGRRSLLVYKTPHSFVLSSVLSRSYEPTFELPSGKIYSLCTTSQTIHEFDWSLNKSKTHSLDDWFQSLGDHADKLNYDPEFVPSCPTTEEDSNFIALVEKIAHNSKNDRFTFLKDVSKIETVEAIVTKLIVILSESVKQRVMTQQNRCQKCISTVQKCKSHSSVGLLFSGGLDCTILAALAHQFIPQEETIDLLNVSFNRKAGNGGSFDTPDRTSSLHSFEELQYLFPTRKWNLIEINVTEDELHEMQIQFIADVIHPLKTILDESLGSALWFAARGKSDSYNSQCRILLTGIGADELFGGYTRHRNEYKRRGWAYLERELNLDWQRIGSRNLARDDRVISQHGRQPRMPYLDESFVDYVLKLKPWHKCFFPESACQQGAGDKMILRLVALKLGLINAAILPKRALQFGSRIALKNENAKDISQRLLM